MAITWPSSPPAMRKRVILAHPCHYCRKLFLFVGLAQCTQKPWHVVDGHVSRVLRWTCVDLFRRQPIESQRDRVPLVYHVARDHARQSKARSPPIVTQSGGRLSQTGYMGGLYHLLYKARYRINQSKPSRRSQSKFMVGVYM